METPWLYYLLIRGVLVGAESLRGKSALFRRNGRSFPNNDGTNIVSSTCFLLMLSSAIRWKPLSLPFHRSGN